MCRGPRTGQRPRARQGRSSEEARPSCVSVRDGHRTHPTCAHVTAGVFCKLSFPIEFGTRYDVNFYVNLTRQRTDCTDRKFSPFNLNQCSTYVPSQAAYTSSAKSEEETKRDLRELTNWYPPETASVTILAPGFCQKDISLGQTVRH